MGESRQGSELQWRSTSRGLQAQTVFAVLFVTGHDGQWAVEIHEGGGRKLYAVYEQNLEEAKRTAKKVLARLLRREADQLDPPSE